MKFDLFENYLFLQPPRHGSSSKVSEKSQKIPEKYDNSTCEVCRNIEQFLTVQTKFFGGSRYMFFQTVQRNTGGHFGTCGTPG